MAIFFFSQKDFCLLLLSLSGIDIISKWSLKLCAFFLFDLSYNQLMLGRMKMNLQCNNPYEAEFCNSLMQELDCPTYPHLPSFFLSPLWEIRKGEGGKERHSKSLQLIYTWYFTPLLQRYQITSVHVKNRRKREKNICLYPRTGKRDRLKDWKSQRDPPLQGYETAPLQMP